MMMSASPAICFSTPIPLLTAPISAVATYWAVRDFRSLSTPLTTMVSMGRSGSHSSERAGAPGAGRRWSRAASRPGSAVNGQAGVGAAVAGLNDDTGPHGAEVAGKTGNLRNRSADRGNGIPAGKVADDQLFPGRHGLAGADRFRAVGIPGAFDDVGDLTGERALRGVFGVDP